MIPWRRNTGEEREALRRASWIDEFIERVRPYVYVRLEDLLLIKRPNQAVKLNGTGALVLRFLLDGNKVEKLFKRLGRDRKKFEEAVTFLAAVKLQLEGSPGVICSPAVTEVPFAIPFSDYPVLSEVALTYRCNLRCCFCYAGCNCTKNPAGSDREMSESEVLRVIRKLSREAKVPSISFTGGEPLLAQALTRYVRAAKREGLRVNLITNGTLVDAGAAKRLRQAGLDSAQVSIEGVTAETHNRVVGVEAFERSIGGLLALHEAGVHAHCNTTINAINRHECERFPRFVRERLGLKRFSMNLIIPAGSGSLSRDLQVHYFEVGEILERIIEESRREEVEFMWYSPVPMCLFNSIVHGLGNKGCSACEGLISISASGGVLPCASYPESVGDFLNQDFETLWRSPRARFFREKRFAFERCRACEDFALCNGACPLYWQAHSKEELPMFEEGGQEVLCG